LSLGYIELGISLHQWGVVDPLETVCPLSGLNVAHFPQDHVPFSSLSIEIVNLTKLQIHYTTVCGFLCNLTESPQIRPTGGSNEAVIGLFYFANSIVREFLGGSSLKEFKVWKR
jgi:hypothetical protein